MGEEKEKSQAGFIETQFLFVQFSVAFLGITWCS
jgi:hypothetical protein